MKVVTPDEMDAFEDDPYENLDLTELCQALADSVPLQQSYVTGKTAIRNAIMDRLGCSAATAEKLADRLEAEGLIQFMKHSEGPLVDAHWWIDTSDRS